MSVPRLCTVLWLMACAASASAQVVDVRQGTNLSLALSPDSQTIVVDLLGGLWQLPVSGGGATALIPSGSGVAQPRFDPSGQRIAFQRWTDGQWDLWVLDRRSGSWTPVTETPFNEREPEFTSDGKSLLFSSDRSGNYCIWSMDLATGEQTQLSFESGMSRFPSVSDNGRIAYVRSDAAGSSLELLRDGGPGTTLLERQAQLAAPSWRPGGDVLLFNERHGTESSQLRLLINADEPVLRSLTEHEDVFVSRVAWLSASEYVYAADGQLWRRGLAERKRQPIHLFAGATVNKAPPKRVDTPLDPVGPQSVAGIMDIARQGERAVFVALGDLWLLEGRRLRQLTDDPFVEAAPQFTPDGESLIFAGDLAGKFDIWRMQIATGSRLRLTDEPGNAYAPTLSPDGERVVFLRTDGRAAWQSSALERLELAHAYRTESLAEDLYDARDLRWESGHIRLGARRGSADEPLTEIVLADPASADSTVRAEPTAAGLELPASAAPTWTAATAAEPFVVQAGRVFDGVHDEYLHHMDIHVRGQRIEAIVRRGRLPLPERVVDAQEQTVIPGFIDVHAHHSATAGERVGREWLAHGVTTVREVDAALAAATERFESWASGRRPGPRLVITLADPAEPGDHADSAVVIQAADEVSPGFAHALAAQQRQFGIPGLRLPMLARPGLEDARPALEFSPLNISYQDVIGRILASGAYVATGLAAVNGAEPSPVTRPLTDTLGRLMRSAGRVAIGSDAPAVPYGSGFHEELELLAAEGIPNGQILRWATAGGAMAMGLDLQLGTLEAGKLADFQILDGDPLERISDVARLEAVVKGGIWFDRDALLLAPAR